VILLVGSVLDGNLVAGRYLVLPCFPSFLGSWSFLPWVLGSFLPWPLFLAYALVMVSGPEVTSSLALALGGGALVEPTLSAGVVW
jgi:hypothetical protein